jgi:hypothetical protein
MSFSNWYLKFWDSTVISKCQTPYFPVTWSVPEEQAQHQTYLLSKRKQAVICTKSVSCLEVRGSVHHSTIHTEKSNKMQQCIKIYYSTFLWSSTCFGWHTTHHREPKAALAASGFAHVGGFWTCGCWTLSHLPCDLLVRGFQLNIFLTVLVSGILCTWPNQLSLWALM